MPDKHAARRSTASRINQVLSEFGLENSVSGGKFDELRQAISPATGYWADRSVMSKPPRLILHFEATDPQVTVSMPEWNSSGTFAYANTARRPVGGLLVRILPVIKLIVNVVNDMEVHEYVPYAEWEWLLWYGFWPKLRNGSSGQVFDGFNPEEGTFTYMGENQPYIAAGLIALNEPEDMCRLPQHGDQMTYFQATHALRHFIQVNLPDRPQSAIQQGGA